MHHTPGYYGEILHYDPTCACSSVACVCVSVIIIYYEYEYEGEGRELKAEAWGSSVVRVHLPTELCNTCLIYNSTPLAIPHKQKKASERIPSLLGQRSRTIPIFELDVTLDL